LSRGLIRRLGLGLVLDLEVVVAAKVVVDVDRAMNRALPLSPVLVLVLGQVFLHAVDASLILARFLGSLRIVIERDR
jgi:hypothetical protein